MCGMAGLSDHGDLMTKFLSLPLPRMFMYGEQNASPPYLQHLLADGVQLAEPIITPGYSDKSAGRHARGCCATDASRVPESSGPRRARMHTTRRVPPAPSQQKARATSFGRSAQTRPRRNATS